MIKIDKWLEDDLINYLSDTFLYRYPHRFLERSKVDTKPHMYAYDFNSGGELIDFLSVKAQNQVVKEYPISSHTLALTRRYFNVAHPGMDGVFHVDSHESNVGPSIMLMVTPKGEGGGFYYRPDPNDPLCIEEVEYEQNRLLIFDGNIEHRGTSFKDKPRITLVFKTEHIDG
jgi:hypothetical protein